MIKYNVGDKVIVINDHYIAYGINEGDIIEITSVDEYGYVFNNVNNRIPSKTVSLCPFDVELYAMEDPDTTRDYNVGDSNYADFKIQPWDIWEEYGLNPWDADIIKRTLRTKKGQKRVLDYEKIIHICKERIRQLNK